MLNGRTLIRGNQVLGEKTYHRFDSVTTWSSDGHASTALGSIVPHVHGQGSAEEAAGEGIA